MMTDCNNPDHAPPDPDEDLAAKCRDLAIAFVLDDNAPPGVDWRGLLDTLAGRLVDGDFTVAPGLAEYQWLRGAEEQSIAAMATLCGNVTANIGTPRSRIYRVFTQSQAPAMGQFVARYMSSRDIEDVEVVMLESLLTKADIHERLVLLDVTAAALKSIGMPPATLYGLRK